MPLCLYLGLQTAALGWFERARFCLRLARLILFGFPFVRSAGTGGRRGRGRQRIPIMGFWQQAGRKTALFGILGLFCSSSSR